MAETKKHTSETAIKTRELWEHSSENEGRLPTYHGPCLPGQRWSARPRYYHAGAWRRGLEKTSHRDERAQMSFPSTGWANELHHSLSCNRMKKTSLRPKKNRKRRSKNRKMQFISGNSMLLSVTNLSSSNWLQNENKIKVKPWRHGSCPYPPPGPLPKFLSIYHFSSSYLHSWCVWIQLSHKITLNFFLPHHIYSKTWVPYNLIQKSDDFRVQCFQGK